MLLLKTCFAISLSHKATVNQDIWPYVWDQVSEKLSADPVIRCVDRVTICSIISNYPPDYSENKGEIVSSRWSGAKAFRLSITKYAAPAVYRVPSIIGDNRSSMQLHMVFDQYGAETSVTASGTIELHLTFSPYFVGICEQNFLKTQVQHNLKSITFSDKGVIDNSLKLMVNILSNHLSLEIALDQIEDDDD